MGVRIEGGCSAGVYVEWELKGRSWEIAAVTLAFQGVYYLK